MGSVLNAHITSRGIHIGGETRDCRLGALSKVELANNLVDSEIILGDLSSSRPQIKNAILELSRLIDQQDILTRQIRRDAEYLHSTCNTPRFEINLNVGKIIRHDTDEIRIDLGQFYRHLNKDQDQDIDSVLGEFFNKGVIGVLSRVNRAYFVENRAHERVFLKLIQELRQLVSLVRQRDILQARIEDERSQVGTFIADLTDPHRLLRVQGRIFPEVQIRFNRPDIQLGTDGLCQIDDHPVDLCIRRGPEPEQYQIERKLGSYQVTAADLKSVAFKLGAEERIEFLSLAPAEPEQSAPFSDSHILVVEDALKMRTFICESLGQAGFNRIEGAEDGSQALTLLAKGLAELVFLEWDMIRMRGLDCMRAIGELTAGEDLPIIAVTSRGSEESVATATREGAAGYLLKPFTAEELVDKVEEVLAARAERGREMADSARDLESQTL